MGTIIFLFLILTQFYGYMGLQGLPFMLTTHVGILVLGVFLGYKKGNLFNKYLIMMVVSLILCAISSKVYRNQSFISSLYASLFILDIFFYYFLVYLNVGVKRFEKVLVILIVATCLVDNEGKNFLYSGYWKVYANVSEKVHIFNLFDNARKDIIKQIISGTAIEDIIANYQIELQSAAV